MKLSPPLGLRRELVFKNDSLIFILWLWKLKNNYPPILTVNNKYYLLFFWGSEVWKTNILELLTYILSAHKVQSFCSLRTLVCLMNVLRTIRFFQWRCYLRKFSGMYFEFSIPTQNTKNIRMIVDVVVVCVIFQDLFERYWTLVD